MKRTIEDDLRSLGVIPGRSDTHDCAVLALVREVVELRARVTALEKRAAPSPPTFSECFRRLIGLGAQP